MRFRSLSQFIKCVLIIPNPTIKICNLLVWFSLSFNSLNSSSQSKATVLDCSEVVQRSSKEYLTRKNESIVFRKVRKAVFYPK